jgi:hypothetical protein
MFYLLLSFLNILWSGHGRCSYTYTRCYKLQLILHQHGFLVIYYLGALTPTRGEGGKGGGDFETAFTVAWEIGGGGGMGRVYRVSQLF